MDNIHSNIIPQNTLITIVSDKDEELVIRRKKIAKNNLKFMKVGMPNMKNNIKQSINFLYEITQMTKAEHLVINTIIPRIIYYEESGQTGEVKIKLNEFTPTNKIVFSKGYGLLKAKCLVIRTKKEHYMINPNALIPADYTRALELWESKTEKISS